MSKEFMKVYHMPFKAKEIKQDEDFTNFRLQMDMAFEEMSKSFVKQQDEAVLDYLYKKYKDTNVSNVYVLSKPDFEKFLLEMVPKWSGKSLKGSQYGESYIEESIENANPIEALECLEEMWELSCDSRKPEYTLYDTIKQALIKAEKEHNSVNPLMQELDCKDFAELRKYARCGYDKLNKK